MKWNRKYASQTFVKGFIELSSICFYCTKKIHPSQVFRMGGGKGHIFAVFHWVLLVFWASIEKKRCFKVEALSNIDFIGWFSMVRAMWTISPFPNVLLIPLQRDALRSFEISCNFGKRRSGAVMGDGRCIESETKSFFHAYGVASSVLLFRQVLSE